MRYLHDKQVEREGGPRRRGEESHDSREASHDREDKLSYDEEAAPPYISDENEVL